MRIDEKLWAIEQIKQLKARYFRFVDRKQWDDLAGVIAADAVFGVGDRALRGRAAVIGNIRETAGNAKTVHHGYTPEIEIIDHLRAHGTWAMHDRYMERPTQGSAPCGFEGFGFYEDTYVFEDSAWRISACRLRRIALEPRGAGMPAFYRMN